MLNKIITLIEELSPLFGPSARESDVQRAISRHFPQPHGDAIGNLWTEPVSDQGLHIALVAHADEIGVQIMSIEPPGIARFRKIGGLRASSLIGQRLKFVNSRGETIYGIIGSDPMQDNGTDNGLLLKTSDLWVDIGAESAVEFRKQLSVGDFGVFDVPQVTRPSEHRICGKALDDRSGLSVALAAYEYAQAHGMGNVSLVSTAQEELSLYGAKALPVNADVAIVIDVDFCADTPSALAENTPLKLGHGCGICVSADTSPVLLNMVKEIAAEENVRVQYSLGRNLSGGTDAAALRLKGNVATIVLSIPLRYMHTAREIADTRDLEATFALAAALLRRLSAITDKTALVPWK